MSEDVKAVMKAVSDEVSAVAVKYGELETAIRAAAQFGSFREPCWCWHVEVMPGEPEHDNHCRRLRELLGVSVGGQTRPVLEAL